MSRIFYLVSLFFMLTAMAAMGIIGRLVYGDWDGKGGDKITALLNLSFILAGIWLFSQGFRRARRIRPGTMLALAAGGLLLGSVIWSVDTIATIRRGVLYMCLVMGAVGIVGRMSREQFMDLLFTGCAISAIGSVVLLVVSHHNAMMDDGLAIRGIFPHKSVGGQVMAIGAIASLHMIGVGGRRRLFGALMLGVFIVLTHFMKSTTSLLVILACCGMDVLFALWRRGGAARAIAMSSAVVLAPVMVTLLLFPDMVLEMLGKDPTLTGRTELWALVLDDIAKRPILGWGYGAFWLPAIPEAIVISTALGWFVPQAHNGLLEITLEVGIVGAVLFVVLLVRNMWYSIRCLRTPARRFATTALYLNASIILVGTSETVLLEPFQVSTITFFAMGLLCERAITESRRRRVAIARLPIRRQGKEELLF